MDIAVVQFGYIVAMVICTLNIRVDRRRSNKSKILFLRRKTQMNFQIFGKRSKVFFPVRMFEDGRFPQKRLLFLLSFIIFLKKNYCFTDDTLY